MNYSLKKTKSQKKSLKSLQNEWQEKSKNLHEEKKLTQWADLAVDHFLLIEKTSEMGQAEASQLLSLQAAFKELEEERNLLWIEDETVDELNKKHAIIHIDQTNILTEKNDLFGRANFTIESKQSFKNYYENKRILCHDGIERSKAEIWLKSDRRREFENGIVFNPKVIGHQNGAYNIWRGFTLKPVQGDASKYWDHVRDNICSKNEDIYLFVRKWLACIFQRPDEVHTALVLCGLQGVGKNGFVDPLGELFGQHYVSLSSLGELMSNFNFHLKNAVLIHANEAFWGGHKKEIGVLKAMITDKTCLIEPKGKDRIEVPNYKHVIMSSNEDWPVHLDMDDRRFLVLRVSSERKEDTVYFKAIKDQLDAGGYAALLFDLLNEDISSFNPRLLPNSNESFLLKLRSADPAMTYIYEALFEGNFALSKNEQGVWQPEIPKMDVYDDYKFWCAVHGHKNIPTNKFGEMFKKLLPAVTDSRPLRDGKRTYIYRLPELEVARREFCKATKQTDWIWEEKP
jgi:Family of unknown function (DUF5906)/Poxvirus D5 protein-like